MMSSETMNLNTRTHSYDPPPKNKPKNPDSQQEGNKEQNLDNDSKGKRKVKYPCLICEGDHFTKECPRHEEFGKF